MANYKTYKQYDSRWGNKNYNGSSTMAQAGCGPTSVAMLAYAVDKKVTPWTVAKYMKANGYAVYGNGTAWSGIPASMKHFGLKDVRNIASMSDVFAYLKKRYCAVFLFKAGSRGGITWTTAGHYMAVTSIKIKDGKHYLYMRDSGGRGHTGVYCYETQMKGLISQVWVGYVPGNLKKKKKTTKKKTTAKKKKTAAQRINELAVACAYSINTSSSKWRYPTGKPKKKYKETLDKAYPDRSNWEPQKRAGAKCEIYVCSVLKALGIVNLPTALEDIIKYLEQHKDKLAVVPSKKDDKGHYYTPGMLKGGDVVIQDYKGHGNGAHIFFIVEVGGKKFISEAQYHGKAYPHVSKELKTMRKSSYDMLRVYRAR